MTAACTYTDEQLHRAIDTINYWYDRLGQAIDANDELAADEAGEKYENMLDYYAWKFKVRAAWLEDLATDTRYLGWDMC